VLEALPAGWPQTYFGHEKVVNMHVAGIHVSYFLLHKYAFATETEGGQHFETLYFI